MSKKLKVYIVKAQGLQAKNKGTSSPYCEVTVFDEKGERACPSQTTKVVKEDLNPQWNASMTFMLESEPKEAFTLQVRCWDKHLFLKDKFLGQFTVTFNSKLVSSTEAIENCFKLAARNAQDKVSGNIQLKIQYGDLLKSSTQGTISSVAAQLGLDAGAGGGSGGSNNNNNNNSNNEDDKGLAASVDGISKPPDEASLPKSAQAEEVIENLMGSGKAFIVHEEDTDMDAFEKWRDGPPVTSLKKVGNATISVPSGGNLQAKHSSNNYSLQPVKADVVVHTGKWYYEVKLDTGGQAQIGWCSDDYDGSDDKGDYWAYDGSRSQKMRRGNGISFGQSWSSGDTIGVFLELGENPSVRFSRNGHDLGQAYGASELSKARNLSPFALLSRNMRVTFNFGATPFRFPQHSYNLLHCFLDDKHLASLGQLFHKYCAVANEGTEEDDDFELAIFEAGTDAFMGDLGITDDMDPAIFIIQWKLSCITPWVISKAEWMNGWAVHACSTIADMKKKLSTWRNDLKDPHAFSIYYNWVFDLMRGEKRVLDWEQVKILWKVVLTDRQWPLFDDWLKFLDETKTRGVNQDLWGMIWEFAKQFPNKEAVCQKYDVLNSAFPVKIDDWVEHLTEDA